MINQQSKLTFIVTIRPRSGATVADHAAYIRDAVKSYSGSLRPPGAYGEGDEGDPMFGVMDHVAVVHLALEL